MKKVITNKAGLDAIIIDEHIIVRRTDGTFGVHDATNTMSRQPVTDFDEAPFIVFYNTWKSNKEAERLAKENESKQKELERLHALRKDIAACETPLELANTFNLTLIETASHWSDLYEGRSGYAFLVGNRKEKEILDLAIEIHEAEGEWGEAIHRAGEHHSTFNRSYTPNLEDYQQACQQHFSGNHYFYRSPETDASFYVDTVEKILEDEYDTEEERMEAILEAAKAWKEIVPGYYYGSGNPCIMDSELDHPDFAGYTEDVYTYNYAFKLDYKTDWKQPEEEGEE